MHGNRLAFALLGLVLMSTLISSTYAQGSSLFSGGSESSSSSDSSSSSSSDTGNSRLATLDPSTTSLNSDFKSNVQGIHELEIYDTRGGHSNFKEFYNSDLSDSSSASAIGGSAITVAAAMYVAFF